MSEGPEGKQVLYSFCCVFLISLKISTVFMLQFMFVLILPTSLSSFCLEQALEFPCIGVVLRHYVLCEGTKLCYFPKINQNCLQADEWTGSVDSSPNCGPGDQAVYVFLGVTPYIARSCSFGLSGHALSYVINTISVRAGKDEFSQQLSLISWVACKLRKYVPFPGNSLQCKRSKICVSVCMYVADRSL